MGHHLVKNTFTNYLTVFVRVLQAVLVTRWTVSYLGMDFYGLWALLWSFFSYALLLDFGFGAAAQKYTSMEIYKSDISKYNRIISTVLSFHFAMSALIVVGTITASFYLSDIINVHDAEKLSYSRTAFLIFGLSTGVVFPLGMFSEILVGLQKIYLRNYVNISTRLMELVGTLLIFLFGGRLISLVIFTMITALISNLAMWFLAAHAIKGFKLSLKLDRQTCKQIASFSGFVYLMSMSRLVLNKSNRLLISIFCGLSEVGAFHLASRLPEFALMGASQYQENIRPISANLHAKGDIAGLCNIIFQSMRWNVFISIVTMLPCFLFAGELIEILFAAGSPEITYMCRLFLASTFLLIACRKIPESYLQMSDNHKLTGYVMTAEAAFNLAFNIAMLPKYGVAIVLVNSIWIRALFTFLIIMPRMILNLKMSVAAMLLRVYIIPLAIAVPAALCVFPAAYLRPRIGLFWSTGIGCAASVSIFVLLAYIFMLDAQTRKMALQKISAYASKFLSKINRKKA